MLLESLVKYYDLLAEDEDEKSNISKCGYGKAKVSYALSISESGELSGVIPLKEMDSKGKKEIPKEMEVPEQASRTSAIFPYFLCDNSSYVLGFGDNIKGKDKRAAKCFSAITRKMV